MNLTLNSLLICLFVFPVSHFPQKAQVIFGHNSNTHQMFCNLKFLNEWIWNRTDVTSLCWIRWGLVWSIQGLKKGWKTSVMDPKREKRNFLLITWSIFGDSNCSSGTHVTYCKQFAVTSYSAQAGCVQDVDRSHTSSHNLWLMTSVIINSTVGIRAMWCILTLLYIRTDYCSATKISSLFNHAHMLSQVAASRCGVLRLFVSTLGNERAGKCCHIVPIHAQWHVCCSPSEW